VNFQPRPRRFISKSDSADYFFLINRYAKTLSSEVKNQFENNASRDNDPKYYVNLLKTVLAFAIPDLNPTENMWYNIDDLIKHHSYNNLLKL
jgi:hypothetical protein